MSLRNFINLIVVLVLLNIIFENYHGAEGMNDRIISKEEDKELDKKLKILNKHPVKSIQMKPNLIQEQQNDVPLSNMVSSMARSKLDGCSSETVPIRSYTKEELINTKYLSNRIQPRHADGFKET
ncbi:hypothetical protein C5167_004193 [Papaver somniferum]|nr:hypothetical protein C5167_004193 [Papaver somniferum]